MTHPEGADSSGDDSLPVSWDEARELVTFVLLAAASSYFLSRFLQFLDGGSSGQLGDHLLLITWNVNPASGMLCLGAGLLIATTPDTDVVPALRTGAAIVCSVLTVAGVIAIVLTLTQSSPEGVLARLATVAQRSGVGTMLCATAGWLIRRVRPFPG